MLTKRVTTTSFEKEKRYPLSSDIKLDIGDSRIVVSTSYGIAVRVDNDGTVSQASLNVLQFLQRLKQSPTDASVEVAKLVEKSKDKKELEGWEVICVWLARDYYVTMALAGANNKQMGEQLEQLCGLKMVRTHVISHAILRGQVEF